MYQYSLQWFTKLFELGVNNAANPGGLEERLVSLNEYFTTRSTKTSTEVCLRSINCCSALF